MGRYISIQYKVKLYNKRSGYDIGLLQRAVPSKSLEQQLSDDHLGPLCNGVSNFLWSGGQHKIVL